MLILVVIGDTEVLEVQQMERKVATGIKGELGNPIIPEKDRSKLLQNMENILCLKIRFIGKFHIDNC